MAVQWGQQSRNHRGFAPRQMCCQIGKGASVGRITAAISAALAVSAVCLTSASAQSGSLLIRDSFPIGDSNGILCQVQDRSTSNPAKQSIFDRRWAIVCRDNPQPIAEVFAFKSFDGAAKSAVQDLRRFKVDCAPGTTGAAGPVAGSAKQSCKITGTDLGWSQISADARGLTFYAEGFAAYDDATVLALRSVLDNAIAKGTIDVASTSVSDPLNFARVQAETLKPEQALAEGYRRNLAGEYAEAAAYFETLQKRLEDEDDDAINPGEFFVNRALQKSNLGEFGVANRLFAQARTMGEDDPITARLLRNFEAIHLLNQGFSQAAIDRLNQQLVSRALGVGAVEDGLAITLPLSERLNSAQDSGFLFGIVDELSLTVEERAKIIDAQALQIRGTAKRILGDTPGAREDLVNSYAQAVDVRDGRVTSITRLRSQVLADLALIAERGGNASDAEAYLRNGLALLQAQYPDRRAVSAAEARLAAYLLRQDRDQEAMALYGKIIDRAVGKRNAIVGFANQLNPYYEALAQQVASDPAAADAFFKATQVLIRPGVAETQAILSRQLSANSDEAARLFRQSIDLGREIERSRIRFEALTNGPQSVEARQQIAQLGDEITTLEAAQLSTQVQLNAYPQYRAVTPSSLDLADFRAALKPGEVYARIAIVSDDVYMFYADRNSAKAYKVDMSAADLAGEVDAIRETISVFDGSQYVTFPFDIASARGLYAKLFEPIGAEIAAADHVIFEPDGAMLRLPVDLLVADDASVEVYQARLEQPDADEYDFTGVNWLGKGRMVSTAVSAEAFVQSRKVELSQAGQQYLGLGENTAVGDDFPAPFRASATQEMLDCFWPASQWNDPIDASELGTAARLIGLDQSTIITDDAFSDDQIMAKSDIGNYRVLHFATHGLVTPPNPNCPAKPALVTSFGGGNSDGLLSFEEIFELDLDADLVILSACDTAGAASVEATRAAGLSSGGGTELEGLVRAFIGAGGRAVMASHWPAPDDFDATQRLMSEMFRRGRSEDIGAALGHSREILMNEVETSHPYYWAGFAVIGDAARPLLSDRQTALAGQSNEMAGE